MALAGLLRAPQCSGQLLLPQRLCRFFHVSSPLYVVVRSPGVGRQLIIPQALHPLRQSSACQILLIWAVCTAQNLRIFFIHLNGWKNPKKDHLLWHIKIMWNSHFTVYKVLLEYGHSFIHALSCMFSHHRDEIVEYFQQRPHRPQSLTQLLSI